jgi:hypothetical protein
MIVRWVFGRDQVLHVGAPQRLAALGVQLQPVHGLTDGRKRSTLTPNIIRTAEHLNAVPSNASIRCWHSAISGHFL